MSVIKIVKFTCDFCEKEFGDKKSVEVASIPCSGWSDSFHHGYYDFYLCYECSENLRKVIWDHFAHISNISIKRISDKE